MSPSPIDSKFDELPMVKTPPPNPISNTVWMEKYRTPSVTIPSKEAISPEALRVASTRQTSKLSLDQSDQVALPCGKQSHGSSSEPRGSLETTGNNASNGESTKLLDDTISQRKLQSKRKRRSSPDPNYVDSAESPEAKLQSKRKRRSSPDLNYVDSVETPEAKLRKKSQELGIERRKTTMLQRANGDLLETIKKLEAKVKREQRQRQESSRQYGQRLTAALVASDDDSVLRQLLKNLGQKCTRWAESYAAAPGSDDMSLEQRQHILEVLKRYQAVSLEGQELIFLQEKSREILLNATLTHLIYLEILVRPFYFFQHAVDAGGPKELEASLTWLHVFTSTGDTTQQANAAKWQAMLAQTLRVLHDHKDTDGEGTNQQQLIDWQAKSFNDVKKRFECSCAGVLKTLNPNETRKRTSQLDRIFRTAGDVSFRLWAQGHVIACQSLGSSGTTFVRASPDMEPHLTMLLDDQDTSRDGQQVHLVVKPRIDAYGNDDGTGFGERRTLDPATVLVCSERTAQPASPKKATQSLPGYYMVQPDEVHSSALGHDLTLPANGTPCTNGDQLLSIVGDPTGPDRRTSQAEARVEMGPENDVRDR